jgi:hypothetical protein
MVSYILHIFQWLEAGAGGVGMGSNLTGGDIKVPAEEVEKLAVEAKKWEDGGKAVAAKLFVDLVAPKSRL